MERGAGPARDLVAVARVVRTQGREGEIRLGVLTDDPARFRRLGECYLVPPVGGERWRVDGVRFHRDVPVLKLHGIESLSAAEGLVGRLVMVPRGAVRPLPADRFYTFDLVGCGVETEEGCRVGTLVDVLGGPGHDFWVLGTGTGECLVPAVSAIVLRVDLEGRVIVIRPPEGLLDLETSA